MNNRGWGMSDLFWILAILGIALLVSMVVYYQNFGNGSSAKDYPEGEAEVTSPTKAPSEPEELEEENKEDDKEIDVDSTLTYGEMEELLKGSAIEYVKKYYSDPSVSEVIIKDEELEREALISGLHDPNDSSASCEGYVIYQKEGNTYLPYLKCGSNYVTNGYNENYQ